jgi:hypothetical protein
MRAERARVEDGEAGAGSRGEGDDVVRDSVLRLVDSWLAARSRDEDGRCYNTSNALSNKGLSWGEESSLLYTRILQLRAAGCATC